MSWKSLVQGGGYLSPEQRKAFEYAIDLVLGRLHATLDQPTQGSGHFQLDRYVDGLETLFLRDATAQDLQSDAAVTAFWIVRLFADRILRAADTSPSMH
ncbi:HrpW-specific chaperone [Pseudomonas sp. FP1742]|uniref:HrpW-specific chaperone n=1 Tax=Pseudomonas sp. FP1742 TaxID=2954079 RepID=UPI002732CB59|nr:HrpW-specific chaperone [Pseudomonas sp. FP1742]WLG48102.1 HrpW-specific chaperone [Pseudomonas sp. FP1742]